LRNSALVLFKVTANDLFSKIPASGTDFQNTGFLPASAKLTVKYRWPVVAQKLGELNIFPP